MLSLRRHNDIFKPNSGASAFFISILVWGVGVGCFAATMNNFLSEIHDLNAAERGWLEFFREMPGLALVFILALLYRVSDWRIMRLGTLISILGVSLLLLPVGKYVVIGFIMIWSLGEHLVMPVRNTIAMQVARPENAGQSLGTLSSAMHFGQVLGNILVALIFWGSMRYFQINDRRSIYDCVWILIFVMLAISLVCTFAPNAPLKASKRTRLYFHRKYWKFYALELFYGARKQVFMTFAPYVLIRIYGFDTATMALLLGVCATVNIVMAPLVGRLTDCIGYRRVMIYDTVILFFVCLLYGYAGDIFPAGIVVPVLCVNFLLDSVISTSALATNIYAKVISNNENELTSTLSTGISINHFISVLAAPFGGWVWSHYGVGMLFVGAAVMAVFNTLFAMTISKNTPGAQGNAKA
jgi:predicted MFS family arabinose efflux permease